MSRRLLIVPDGDRVEQWLLEEAQRSEFVDLRDVWTVAQLLQALEPASFAQRAPADPLWVRMVVGKLAGEHAGVFGPSAHSAEFAAQVQEVFTHLRGQGATARLLEEAAGALEGAPRVSERARAIASLWRAVDAQLDEAKRVDVGEWWRLAAERLEAQGLPASMRVFSSIEIRFVHDVTPARLAVFEALARACQQQSTAFAWRWPGSGEVACDAFVVEAVRAAESRWAGLEAELSADLSGAPLAWVAPALFAGGLPSEAPELSAFCAPSQREEIREIARRVRRLVTAGVPPETICIAWRELAEDTELVVEALSDVGVPVRARRGVPLTQSPQGRHALSLLELADDGFPADAVAAVLESRAVKVLSPEAADPRAAFREAGVRDDRIGAVGEQGAYAVRLGAAIRRAQRDEVPARSLKLLLDAVETVRSVCRAIPEQGPAQELLDAWWDAVSKLGLLQENEAAPGGDASPLLKAELDRALAREQAAVEALATLLSSLRESLKWSGLGRRFMSRRDFARWVRVAAAELNLAARGPRAGAVWLLDARELAGREFAQVFVGGLVDGRFPGRPSPQPLFSEDERLALNQAAGRALFRVTVGEGEIRLPVRLAEDRLLLHLALCSAASVTLSRARLDDGGRELLPSPFLDGLARAVTGFVEEPIARSAVPRLDDVQTESELRARVALETLSPAITRQSVPDEGAFAVRAQVEHEPWFQLAQRHSAMEQERLRFFSDPSAPAGAFSGRVEGGVLDALQPRLAFDAAHPVAAHELQEWGTCAFRGLSTMVMGLRAGESAGEEIDSRTRGNFWHEALAEVVEELARTGLLGKDESVVRPLVERAVEKAAEKTEGKSSTGHPALWALAKSWAVTVVVRLVTSANVTPFGLARPKHFEVPFGTSRSPEALREVKVPAARSGERDVFLTGRIDRVDVGSGAAGVVDYKTSVKRNVSKDFLVREFQMAFYLLAVKSLVPDAVPNGAWHAVGRNQLTTLTSAVRGLALSDVLATDEFTRARLAGEEKPNLANAVFGLVGKLRAGDFSARPVDCEYCDLKAVCRISERRLPEEKR